MDGFSRFWGIAPPARVTNGKAAVAVKAVRPALTGTSKTAGRPARREGAIPATPHWPEAPKFLLEASPVRGVSAADPH
jgi:hypothetical protein